MWRLKIDRRESNLKCQKGGFFDSLAIYSPHPTPLRSYDLKGISKPKLSSYFPDWIYAARRHNAATMQLQTTKNPNLW